MAHKKQVDNKLLIGVIAVVAILVLFNQWQIAQLSGMTGGSRINSAFGSVVNRASFTGSGDLGDVDLASIQNTAQAVAAIMPIDQITDSQSAINVMIPTGTPEYGEAMGVSYDNPIEALGLLARAYRPLKADLQTNDPETWERYLALATKPVGISCEFCCGVGPNGITPSGDLRCGCKHNPGIQALTMWLMKNTEMTDAEVLQEALRWKTVWFPRDMVGLGMQLAGGDTSALKDVPGMVGGC